MISSQPINVVAKQMPARDASEIRKQRKRKPVEMDSMPEDDAAERKRVLNVLAQRRYSEYTSKAGSTDFLRLISTTRTEKEAGASCP